MAVSRQQINKTLIWDGDPVIPETTMPSLIQRYTTAYIYRLGIKLEGHTSRLLYAGLYRASRRLLRDVADTGAEVDFDNATIKQTRAWAEIVNAAAKQLLTAYGDTAARILFDRVTQSWMIAYYGTLWELDEVTVDSDAVKVPPIDVAAASRAVLQENLYGDWTGDDLAYSVLGKAWREEFADVIDETLLGIRKTVRLGLSQREGVPQIRKRLNKLLGAGVKSFPPYGITGTGLAGRLTTLTRTLMTASMSRASIQAAKDNAHIVKAKQWDTMRDSKVCPICRPLQGRQWKLGDEQMLVPAEMTHPNCRCILLDVIFSPSEGGTPIKDDDAQPGETLPGWLRDYGLDDRLAKLQNFDWTSVS